MNACPGVGGSRKFPARSFVVALYFLSFALCQPLGAQGLRPHEREAPATDPLVSEIHGIAAEIGRRMGVSLPGPIVVLGDYSQEELPQVPGVQHSITLAVATPMRPLEDPSKPGRRMWVRQEPSSGVRMDTCVIRISADLRLAAPLIRTVYLAHEVMHCYQFALGTLEDFTSLPLWVKEGTAQFAGEDYAAVGSYANEPYWRQYLTGEASLFDRSYDAMGFFFHLKSRGIDPYPIIKLAILAGPTAAATVGSPSSALLMSIIRADTGDDVFSQWPTSLARRRDLGTEWDSTAPGIPPEQRAPLVGSVSEGSPFELNVDAAQQKLLFLAFPRGEILRLAIEGYGGIHWDPAAGGGSTEWYALAHLGSYCVAGTCQCPDGSVPPGVREVRGTPALIALSGGETAGRLVARSEEPRDCRRENTPPSQCETDIELCVLEFLCGNGLDCENLPLGDRAR